jgi:hypothetical protein
LPGINTLAYGEHWEIADVTTCLVQTPTYLPGASVTKKKSFVTLTPGAKIINILHLEFKKNCNKLVFVTSKPFQPIID